MRKGGAGREDVDLHFGMTRQCPRAIGPMSMKAKTDSVSSSFILRCQCKAAAGCRV